MKSKIEFFKSSASLPFLDFLDVVTVTRFARSHTLCQYFSRNLRHIKIEKDCFNNPYDEGQTISGILKLLPHLHRLHTLQIQGIADEWSHSSHLNHLNITAKHFLPALFKQLPREIRQVDLSGHQSKEMMHILLRTPIPDLPYLQSLNLRTLSCTESFNPDTLQQLHVKLAKCPMLRKVKVTMDSKYNTEAMVAAFKNMHFDIAFLVKKQSAKMSSIFNRAVSSRSLENQKKKL